MTGPFPAARRRSAVALLAWIAFSSGCDTPPSAPVEPDLSGFEPAVVESFHERRNRVENILRDSRKSAPERAEAWAELGAWYQAHYLFDGAVFCYRSAADADRKNFEWHALEADAALAAGRVEEAYEILLEGLSEVSDPSALWLELAEAELRTGRLGDAREHFEQALATDRSSVRARLGLGQTEIAAGDFSAALRVLRAASTLRPGVREIEQALGLAYRGRGDADEADDHLRRATRARPLGRSVESPWLERVAAASLGAQGHATRGRQARDQGRLDEAIVHFRRALEAAPGVPVHYRRLGGALLQNGAAQEARAVLAAGIDRFPDHPGLILELAKAEAELGSVDRALDALLRLQAADPKSVAVAQTLEVVYARLGRFEEAAEECMSVLAERLDQAEVLVRCARWHTVLGRWQTAASQLEEALASRPGDAGARLLLARLLAASPDPRVRDGARALSLARRGVVRTRSAFTLETLAMALAEIGEFGAAVEAQRDAVALAGASASRIWASRRLTLYERRIPCRLPLHPEELAPPDRHDDRGKRVPAPEGG